MYPESNQIVNLKRKGYSQKEIAEKLGITQQTVSYRLIRARKEGLWDGREGLSPRDELSYEDYLESAKNSDMIGRPLTREEWKALWKDEKFPLKKEKEKSASSYYRCPRCMTKLIPLDKLAFNPRQVHALLKQKGITHFCTKCLVGYRRLDKSVLRQGKCYHCGQSLVRIVYKGESLGFYCEDCKLLYSEDELEKEGFKEVNETEESLPSSQSSFLKIKGKAEKR